jgi:hypothetical protein
MQILKSLSAIVKTAIRAIMPNCREVTRLQSEALDKKLPFSKRVGLRLHLLVCSWCRRYGKQIRFLREAMHDHPEELCEASSQSLSPEARERMKRALHGQVE